VNFGVIRWKCVMVTMGQKVLKKLRVWSREYSKN